MEYKAIHDKWQKFWKDNQTNKFDPKSKKPKYYTLEMFPYPSGSTLHLGHFFNFAPSDTHARFKRMTGFNVFHPMGFDAFGLPAENHALSTNTHPQDNTVTNMEKFREQLDKMGGMYDWDYTLTTCFPDFYKWTQWLFLQLFKAKLAYRKAAAVNWCGKCKTVLANEQVQGNACERCDTEIIKRPMESWFFKITDYAERLLGGLDNVDWPSKTKLMQKNWIGKSEGALVEFDGIEVFTTRLDTIFGATFIAISPEHELTKSLIQPEWREECDVYIIAASKKTEVERQDHSQKTGVFTGTYVKNPASGALVPVYIADYVLATYGTGAVMGVPAHDERDFDFAVKYELEIRRVIKPADCNKAKSMGGCAGCEKSLPYMGDGTLVNSDKYNGLTVADAQVKMAKDFAKTKTIYRLRDWGIGRQRYWGAPIPIVYCKQCGIVPVPENQLPVLLPYIKDFRPKGDAPLASCAEFVNTTCPLCGIAAKRETETMDTFVCSSWYFLRYPDAKNEKVPFEKPIIDKLLPVDKYVGGAEHACMHLLYARFVTMFMHDKGFVNFTEPFPSLVHQGMILAPDGQKMSKSKGNTITPDKYVDQYGSDILRLFMLFGFNYVDGGPWSDDTLKSVTKFVTRIENLIKQTNTEKEESAEVLYVMHNTIKSVREDLDSLSFNTAVARVMELVNAIYVAPQKSREAVKTVVLLVAPMIPHLAEEFWQMLGETPSVFDQEFPNFDKNYLTRDSIEIAVQVNSKIVGRVNIPTGAAQADVEKLCAEFIKGQNPKKVIYIQNKLINFVG